ncbi:NADH-quinone oxidoreductase subunit D [Kosmotoga pacifica]|uniref:NADH-quinone oxidoreductase subunit D n=1 Tax=Kosmotoga pacifica TaxID=1330330 RepID=A0A0G2Z4Y0_9BACT|nr:NADH-quinone oxidoreductase subunit D [Kosmotoga pacifica]AKI96670.1 NADH-quinone oxidoreductase subunit D [Kosmotoga pacifica]
MSKEVKLFLGPNHPGMHGNSSVHLYVEGDTVVKSRLVPGFLHRGFEKLMERRTWMQNLALIPRICVPEPDINEMVYAMAIETLTGIEVPEKAHWIRMIILELARIAAHLMAMGGIGGATGLYTMPYWVMPDRDRILDIFEKITGARIYHMYIIPGGVRKDLPQGIEKDILEVLDYIESRSDEYENLLLKHRVIRTRTKGLGVLTREEALEMGVTGVGLRATGLPYDIRKVDPYARYDKVEFEVPTATEGDGYARFTLKYLELQQSIRIIRQCIDMMPKEGPVNVRFSRGSALRFRVPAGSVYAHVESSRGEYGYFVVSDGGEKPYRIHVRGASYPQGLYGVENKLPGTRIEDVALWLGTMDFCSPEIDR